MFTTKRSTSILSWTEYEPRRHATLFKLAVIFSLLTTLLGGGSCEKEKGTGASSRTNSPPVVSAVRILPENPTQQNAVTASIDAHDPDGDPITYEYQWIKNGADVSAQDNNVLQHSHFKKGDVIRVRVTPGDGKGKGEPFLSPEVKIRNSPPVIQEVWIEPKVAYASDPLKALVKAEDKDGGFVYYTYQWEKNGVLLSEERGAVLEPGRFKKGDSVTVTRTRVPSPPATVPATAVAVPVAMAAAASGRDLWPVMAELRPAVLARSRLERPGRDDPFTTPAMPGPVADQGGRP